MVRLNRPAQLLPESRHPHLVGIREGVLTIRWESLPLVLIDALCLSIVLLRNPGAILEIPIQSGSAAFLLAVITFLDRVCISVAVPRIQEHLQIGPQQWGWVVGVFAIRVCRL